MKSRKHWRLKERRGIAVTELAVCLPLLFLIIFGSIEACNAIFLRQALTEAAYEGALVGMKPSATTTQVEQRVQSILDARSITGSTIFAGEGVQPIEQLATGARFRVRVSASVTGNVVGPRLFFGASTLEAELVSRRL